jgi:hypothetical protein
MENYRKSLKEFEIGEKKYSFDGKETKLRYFDAISMLIEVFLMSFEQKFLEHLDNHRKEFFETFEIVSNMMEV